MEAQETKAKNSQKLRTKHSPRLRSEARPRSTRIVCTIGPASKSPEMIERLIRNGMNVARFNFSHGSHDSHLENIETIREVSKRIKQPVAILQDLQGHKVRVGTSDGVDSITLEDGQEVILGAGSTIDSDFVGIDYEGAAEFVGVGEQIYLDDGSLELYVLDKVGDKLRCRVEVGGELKGRKGVMFPDSDVEFPLINEKDNNDAKFGVSADVDMLAMSFVRSATEILEMRIRLSKWGKDDSFIVAKIEDRKGVDNVDDILHVADGILIARGDLGVTLPREKVPALQKYITKKANERGVPVITATQMLESMTFHHKPTRAEVADVHNAVTDRTDAVMLSGETASGSYPNLAVLEMDRICREAELCRIEHGIPRIVPLHSKEGIKAKIAASAVSVAENMDARCIVAFSRSGSTLRALSSARANAPVYGVLVEEAVLRKLLFNSGLRLSTMPEKKKLESLIRPTLARLKKEGAVDPGDLVVVVANESEAGFESTHLLKICVIE
jgi:pyruvate kinase